MREIYDSDALASPWVVARNVWGNVGADWRWARRPAAGGGVPLGARAGLALLVAATLHHGARAAGSLLGARADRLPAPVVRRLSLERRAN